jgi:hypothetical protein
MFIVLFLAESYQADKLAFVIWEEKKHILSKKLK